MVTNSLLKCLLFGHPLFLHTASVDGPSVKSFTEIFKNMLLIYIDFGYKGIPENIPIDKIVIRDAPEVIKKMVSLPSASLEQVSING